MQREQRAVGRPVAATDSDADVPERDDDAVARCELAVERAQQGALRPSDARRHHGARRLYAERDPGREVHDGHQTVLFIVDRYPKAGYTLGRGDAEATEADAPFVKNKVRGLTRVAALEACKTLWLIATAASSSSPNGTSPLLSPHPTSSQTSALPFG
jgi:hypothetical protein